MQSPNTNDMVFDGAFQYPAMIKMMFGVWWYYNNCHRCKDFEDKKNNNMIERFQNFIRSKTHQRRGFKNYRRGLLQINLLPIYYNFIRDHMSLGMTPAEKAGCQEQIHSNKR